MEDIGIVRWPAATTTLETTTSDCPYRVKSTTRQDSEPVCNSDACGHYYSRRNTTEDVAAATLAAATAAATGRSEEANQSIARALPRCEWSSTQICDQTVCQWRKDVHACGCGLPQRWLGFAVGSQRADKNEMLSLMLGHRQADNADSADDDAIGSALGRWPASDLTNAKALIRFPAVMFQRQYLDWRNHCIRGCFVHKHPQ